MTVEGDLTPLAPLGGGGSGRSERAGNRHIDGIVLDQVAAMGADVGNAGADSAGRGERLLFGLM